MNKTVQRILGAVNVPTDTSSISKVAWETGMHTGEAVGQKAVCFVALLAATAASCFQSRC